MIDDDDHKTASLNKEHCSSAGAQLGRVIEDRGKQCTDGTSLLGKCNEQFTTNCVIHKDRCSRAEARVIEDRGKQCNDCTSLLGTCNGQSCGLLCHTAKDHCSSAGANFYGKVKPEQRVHTAQGSGHRQQVRNSSIEDYSTTTWNHCSSAAVCPQLGQLGTTCAQSTGFRATDTSPVQRVAKHEGGGGMRMAEPYLEMMTTQKRLRQEGTRTFAAKSNKRQAGLRQVSGKTSRVEAGTRKGHS
jgi:hypothetical protein